MRSFRILAALALCTTSAPAQAQSLVIESLEGPVTPGELAAFKAFMLTRLPPPNPWGTGSEHNALGDGPPGRDVEAMGQMFEATHDVQILDRMLFFVDAFVAMRNDLPGGAHRVLWTGKIEKVWPPEPPDNPGVGYAGGENGDTIAHILYPVLLVLRTPALWKAAVPDGNPHGYGATYLERAKTYLKMAEEANDEYSAKYFVQPGTNLIRNPPGWPAGFHTMEAINIQMMLDGGFQRDAEAHELLGDAPARVARYDAIVKTSVRECLDGMKHPSQAAGHTVYTWYYYPWDVKHVESVGHAAYDVLGIWRASTRKAYGLGRDELVPIADTLSYVISLGNDSFASNVDGTGLPRNSVQDEWTLASEWNATAFGLIGNAALASKRYARSPATTAAILWMKSRRTAPTDGGFAPPDAAPATAVDALAPDTAAPMKPPAAPDAAAPARDAAPAPEPDPSPPPAPQPAHAGCACSPAVRVGFDRQGALPFLAVALVAFRRRRRSTASRKPQV